MSPQSTYEELARQLEVLQTEVSALRQKTRQYRAAEEKFSKAFHNCPVWVVLSNLEDGRYVEVNETFLKDTGYDRDQVIGRTAIELGIWSDPRDREAIIAAINDQGVVRNVEVLRRDRTGRLMNMQFFGEKIDIDGRPHLLSTSIDVTAQKTAEAALRKSKDSLEKEVRERTADLAQTNENLQREIQQRKGIETALRNSEKKYRTLVDNSLVGIYTTDLEGRMLYANQALAKMFGFESVDEFLDEGVISRYKNPADRKRLIEGLTATGIVDSFEVDLVDKKGDTVTAILYARLENDQISGVLTDITERKQAQQALADSERRLSDIIEFLPDPTWAIDSNGCVIAWNKAVEDLTGVKKGDIIGQCEYAHAIPFYGEPRPTLLNLLMHRNREWEEKYINLKEVEGILVAGDSFHPNMGEGGRYLSATTAKLYDARGRVIGAIQSVRDITDIKKTELEREQLIDELKAALAEVRTLSGLLPICANCKKIRDDRGYWNQIELYIREHTDADFSHGVCPDCARELYPGLDIDFGSTRPDKDKGS